MPHHTCECGARYKFPDSAVGKRAKCQKCGAVFTLREAQDEGMIAIAEDPERDRLHAHTATGTALESAATRDQPAIAIAPGSAGGESGGRGDRDTTAGPPGRNYASDVLWACLFPASPGNLITFIGVWVVVFIAPFVLWFHWVIGAWYAALRFELVRAAAAGDMDLPDVAVPQDFVDDVLQPIALWFESWIFVLLPAFLFLAYACSQGQMAAAQAVDLALGGVGAMLEGSSSGVLIFDTLVYVGLFLWPMVVLCVALGGFSTVSRPDLMLRSIATTFPVYLLTVALMIAATLLQTSVLSAAGGGTGGFVWYALATAARVYLDFVLMQLIGLYYFHHKHRFAWSWG